MTRTFGFLGGIDIRSASRPLLSVFHNVWCLDAIRDTRCFLLHVLNVALTHGAGASCAMFIFSLVSVARTKTSYVTQSLQFL